MYINVAKISSKGQIVIPAEIRKALNIKPEDRFLVFGKDDRIVFKKISEEALEKSFDEIAEPFRKRAEELGLTRTDLEKAIREVRKR